MKFTNTWKRYHTLWTFIIVIVIIVGSFIMADKKYGTKYITYEDLFKDKIIIPTPTTTPVPTATPVPLKPGPEGLAAETFVYYAIDNHEPVIKVETIRYKDEAHFSSLNKPPAGPIFTEIFAADTIYSDSTSKISIREENKPNWTLVVRHPIKESIHNFNIGDRLFTFKKVPQNNTILFAMEWNTSFESSEKYENIAESGLILYTYDADNNHITHIEKMPNERHSYSYPKIKSFSLDGKNVELKLYNCWNCEADQPYTMLMNLETYAKKNLKETSAFMWLGNNNYLYKDYITYPCETSYTGICPTDPDTIPAKYGTFE